MLVVSELIISVVRAGCVKIWLLELSLVQVNLVISGLVIENLDRRTSRPVDILHVVVEFPHCFSKLRFVQLVVVLLGPQTLLQVVSFGAPQPISSSALYHLQNILDSSQKNILFPHEFLYLGIFLANYLLVLYHVRLLRIALRTSSFRMDTIDLLVDEIVRKIISLHHVTLGYKKLRRVIFLFPLLYDGRMLELKLPLNLVKMELILEVDWMSSLLLLLLNLGSIWLLVSIFGIIALPLVGSWILDTSLQIIVGWVILERILLFAWSFLLGRLPHLRLKLFYILLLLLNSFLKFLPSSLLLF